MTIIYTPEQFAAAHNVIFAENRLRDWLYEGPVGDQAWAEWNPQYEAAYQLFEDASSVFRRLLGDINPRDVTAAASANPLLPAIIPDNGVVQTEDGHFLAGPEFHARDIGPWMVDHYDPPLGNFCARRVITIRTDSRDQAQAMVDLMTWALDIGARTSDSEAAVA